MVDIPMPSPEEQHVFKERREVMPANLPVVWNRLGGLVTQAATSWEESFENVKANVLRKHKWFHEDYPVKEIIPGRRIALVGGGPSLRGTVGELADFDTILACGSVHDWLQENAPRPPDYCAVCDPDPVMANYLRKPNKATTYLVAGQCAASVFEALEGHNIVQWHCWPIGKGDQEAKTFLECTPGWVGIGGGCTIGLRGITIALMMGFTELHFFGFDSCMGMTNDEHHVYPFTDETKEFLGDIYNLKIGMGENNGPGIREYRCAGYQLAQAEHYRQSLVAFGDQFIPIFHGPGLLADMQTMINIETKRLTEEQEKAA